MVLHLRKSRLLRPSESNHEVEHRYIVGVDPELGRVLLKVQNVDGGDQRWSGVLLFDVESECNLLEKVDLRILASECDFDLA